MRYILTLQGPTAEGNHLLESWECSESTYLRLRQDLASVPPLATTLTDADAKVISQRFYEEE